MATMTAQDFEGQFTKVVSKSNPVNKFENELVGRTASFEYFGRIFITQPLTNEKWLTIKQVVADAKERSKLGRLEESKINNDVSLINDLDISPFDGYGWGSNEHMRVVARVNLSAFRWGLDFSNDQIGNIEAVYKSLIKSIHARQIFEAPESQGVCLPYVFIKDDGLQPRNIAMTYRLKSHPDITVWLEDSNAAEYDTSTEEGKRHSKQAEPASRINDFWGQYESPEETQIDTIWVFPNHLKTVKLDGREGKASFVEITHLEKPVKTYFGGSKSQYRPKTIDYGYLAVVRGVPKAKKDAPDLRFYVIRNAETAIKQGIKPLEKDEFLKLAEKIAATVKHRPIQ